MKITRSRISMMYLILIFTVLALVSVTSFIASKNTERQLNRIVGETIPLSHLAENILSNLVNQETGIRGFEVTGDEAYLEPYHNGSAALEADLKHMEAFETDYPEIGKIMRYEARPMIERLRLHYASQLSLVRTGNIEAARNRISNGKTAMDSFRKVHDKLTAEIDRITAEANKSAREAERSARTIISIGGALALIISIFSALLFFRTNRAEAALRKSEESFRFLAESLEAQNEEIIAQQEEQERTLEKLSLREYELEAINGFQEKLTSAGGLNELLQTSMPRLIEALQLDAIMVVIREPNGMFAVQHAVGYPTQLGPVLEEQLFGPARRVLMEKQPIECKREATEYEKGFHQGITSVMDHYFPLFGNDQEVIGFLLLTGYLQKDNEQTKRIAKGLIRQFELAFLAQQVNEERLRQSIRLEQLNHQLQQEKLFIEEQRDVIENILESTNEGMVLCDARGQLLYSNQRMKDFFGTQDQDGKHLLSLIQNVQIQDQTLSQVTASIGRLLRGEQERLSERFYFTNREEDGQLRHLELYATMVGNNRGSEEPSYLFVFRDRTEEEKVDEMKNEFISIVSHELRTPLSSVLGFVEIMLHRELTPEKRKRYMETIYKEANRLSKLINDFLDLQRMESGKQSYHFSPVEFNGLLQEVAEQWKGKQSHEIHLDAPRSELWVRGDADRLKQVVHNLLSNAIKYSPQGDRVDIRVVQTDGKIQISVQDYGLGIPEEARGKLFTKFYRVDNSDRRQIGGTGLGLSIVKEIIEGHDGRIWFESVMGAGSIFTLELELTLVQNAENAILVIEDDDNLGDLIQVALTKFDCPSLIVRSAEEAILALQQCKEKGPRLCIVDIHLEGAQSGWDFISELYCHPRYYRTPVIVSTALEPPSHYHEKDMEKFLRKPFSMEKLVQVAEQLLSSTDSAPAYIFPAQDEIAVTSSLNEKGIEIEGITRSEDVLRVEPKSRKESL
ncbi:ATP-binding protein [Paenibacillus sp. GD4]|uniref:ATP-binding protein n=1 Tax=Paenibacillus sp. GD4 TaxID=3068890 RepID=UPI0027964475|nr:ATP-binding protein [Paenibacillus sp. GD4]MDQ1911022.1 ATP-binding protein [Paenibacillus sp. GD4]